MDARVQLLVEDPWYGWESEESDQSWLLSYVDVLSVILAMLLVLLVSELQDNAEPIEAAPSPIVVPATSPPVEPSIEVESLAAPVVMPDSIQPDVLPGHEPTIMAPLPPIETTTQLVDTSSPMPMPMPMPIDGVTMIPDKTGITLKIAEVVLFDSARADLKPGADPVLARVAILLHELGEVDVAVEGHTDDRQIQGGEFGTNWELAAARSSAVTAFLLEQGLAAEHLRVVSYADTRPVADNSTVEGRAQNRRVELRVQFLNQ